MGFYFRFQRARKEFKSRRKSPKEVARPCSPVFSSYTQTLPGKGHLPPKSVSRLL